MAPLDTPNGWRWYVLGICVCSDFVPNTNGVYDRESGPYSTSALLLRWPLVDRKKNLSNAKMAWLNQLR